MSNSEYIPTIGIETHVQLNTKTKLFSAVGNDAREAPPNTLISHIDAGFPGALPVLNEKAVELAARVAFALNTQPQKHSYFERKHYFYPDSPAGYQISQLHAPIIVGGSVEINIEGQKKTIAINRAQLEADAGKTVHPEGADYSLVDLNRAGTPLLEIVSEPEIHSPAEAKAFVRELYLLMKYAQVSNVDLYHGNMRFDVNISVSASDELGIRTEVKNLNSFRSVEAAVEYEIKRQTELLEKGEEVIQETRGWDEAKQKTTGQRSKEEAHDYRYMPEPDIPPIELSDEFIQRIQSEVPILPNAYRNAFKKLDLAPAVADTLLSIEENSRLIYQLVNETSSSNARRIALWFINAVESWAVEELPMHNDKPIPIYHFITLSQMVEEAKISSSSGTIIFKELLNTSDNPEEIAQRKNLMQVSDEGELEEIVKKVIAENAQAAEDVSGGEMKAIGFLVGQVMKASGGKANPGVVQTIIKRQLGV